MTYFLSGEDCHNLKLDVQPTFQSGQQNVFSWNKRKMKASKLGLA